MQTTLELGGDLVLRLRVLAARTGGTMGRTASDLIRVERAPNRSRRYRNDAPVLIPAGNG
jgi:hypothetical protein